MTPPFQTSHTTVSPSIPTIHNQAVCVFRWWLNLWSDPPAAGFFIPSRFAMLSLISLSMGKRWAKPRCWSEEPLANKPDGQRIKIKAALRGLDRSDDRANKGHQPQGHVNRNADEDENEREGADAIEKQRDMEIQNLLCVGIN